MSFLNKYSPGRVPAGNVLNYARHLPEYRDSGDILDQLPAELREIRKKGYAISHGEWQNDASGIASPILDEKGCPIGSISISGPTQRFLDPEKLSAYADLLLNNVGNISRELGYVPEITMKDR